MRDLAVDQASKRCRVSSPFQRQQTRLVGRIWKEDAAQSRRRLQTFISYAVADYAQGAATRGTIQTEGDATFSQVVQLESWAEVLLHDLTNLITREVGRSIVPDLRGCQRLKPSLVLSSVAKLCWHSWIQCDHMQRYLSCQPAGTERLVRQINNKAHR
jgi:hypothetical protein